MPSPVLVAWITLAVLVGPVYTAEPSALDFNKRVRAQEAIERVNYSYQIGTRVPFEQAVSRALLERKVRSYLEKSAALEKIWQTPITSEMLAREVQRMARESRDPARLREIFSALNDDPLLIQECLVRAALAERLVRNFYDFDRSIHRVARTEAEELHRKLVEGKVDPRVATRPRSVVDFVAEDGRADSSDRGVWVSEFRRVRLPLAELEQRRLSWPEQVGRASELRESRRAFTTSVVLSEGEDSIRVARFVTPKRRWDDWWQTVRAQLDPGAVRPVASNSTGLPELQCTGDDEWQLSPLSDYSDFRGQHTTVWTGTEMIVWGGAAYDALNSGSRYDPATDTWSHVATEQAPSGRYDHGAVWTGDRMVVWGGKESQQVIVDTGGSYDPLTNSWTPISTVDSPGPRARHTTVWTGTEMIIWGGQWSPTNYTSSGGRYDPASDQWATMAGGPTARHQHTAVWTGSEMIVWGGRNSSSDFISAGSRYDPATDSWQNLWFNEPQARALHTAVWTGQHMIIWGGTGSSGYLDIGSRYDPVTNLWEDLPTLNGPGPRMHHGAVWTGSEMIVWGGRTSTPLDTGGRYSPLTNSWSAVTMEGAPTARDHHSMIWTGSLMIVWGSEITDGPQTGGRYDPVTDRWTPTSVSPGPPPMSEHTAVWTGNDMIIYGSFGPTGETHCSRYNPATATWTQASTASAPPDRSDHTAVWTGDAMIVWGGRTNTGGVYNPIADAWTPTDVQRAPKSRYLHTAVWTGDAMLVWGGRDPEYSTIVSFGDGASYDPMADRWTPISLDGAPSNRYGHVSVWSGDEMLVWGGSGREGWQFAGGRYDPTSDSWAPVTEVGAPRVIFWYSTAWTGDSMIIWGGRDEEVDTVDTGARYDPVTDSWAPTSTIGAPLARSGHTGIWVGDRLVIWGGHDQLYDELNSGGLYDPGTEQWAKMNPAAPAARAFHTAVWTGSHMIVWGGDNGLLMQTGAEYAHGQRLDADGDGFSVCDGDCNDLDPGSRPGGTETCDGMDNDCNGLIDDAAGPPSDPTWVFWSSSTTLQWGPVTGAGAFDVTKGDLGVLRASDGDFTTSLTACLASRTGPTLVTDPSEPPTASSYFFLVRPVGCDAPGTYDSDSMHQRHPRDAAIDASAVACP